MTCSHVGHTPCPNDATTHCLVCDASLCEGCRTRVMTYRGWAAVCPPRVIHADYGHHVSNVCALSLALEGMVADGRIDLRKMQEAK